MLDVKRSRPSGSFSFLVLPVMCGLLACQASEGELAPDAFLQRELGLTSAHRVHTVSLTTGVTERAEPSELKVEPGDIVQFVSVDWMVHEVVFELDSLDAEARAFLLRTEQVASPPLLQKDSRFVLTFEGAPPGRYRYSLAGNREPGRGEIVVEDPASR